MTYLRFSELRPTQHPSHAFSGRWLRTGQDSFVASWCGASVRFNFYGSALRIRSGPQTERKDSWNGGTPMLGWTACLEGDLSSSTVQTADLEPSTELSLLELETDTTRLWRIELTLIDWASIFELDGIIMDSTARISEIPSPRSQDERRLLVIGDSISCGFAADTDEGGAPAMPRGCLDAFPFVASRLLMNEAQTNRSVHVDLVAYPGITLVDPTESEKNDGMPGGMVERFFHSSPWEDTLWSPARTSTLIIIALGTNDEFADTSSERFSDTLIAFTERLMDAHKTSVKAVCILHPFPDFEDISDSKEASFSDCLPSVINVLRKYAERCYPHISIRAFSVSDNMTAQHTQDAVHPDIEGHELIAKNLVTHIRDMV